MRVCLLALPCMKLSARIMVSDCGFVTLYNNIKSVR